MSHECVAKVIAPKETTYGMPLQALEFSDGGCSYIYGDFLPKNDEERKQREQSVARACEHIILNNASTRNT